MIDAELPVLAALTDREVLALTAWGEARAVPRDDLDSHSPVEELIAVMVVCRNRLKTTYKAVCLAAAQFSCWNPGSGPNHDAVMAMARAILATRPWLPAGDPEAGRLYECLFLADGVISGAILDRTHGAKNYYAPAAMVPRDRVPVWAVGKPAWLIGDQLFL
jgi:hypothetical protein